MLTALALTTLPACASLTVGSQHAPGVRFTAFRTFASQSGKGDSEQFPGPRDASVDTAIRSAVEHELAAHGMR